MSKIIFSVDALVQLIIEQVKKEPMWADISKELPSNDALRRAASKVA